MKLSYVLKYPKSRSVQRLVRRFGTYRRLCIAFLSFKPSSQLLTSRYVLKYKFIIRLLLVRGCPVDTKDNDGLTALYSVSPNVDVCLLLLMFGADANARDVYEYTPLHYACIEENLAIIISLLPTADINSKSDCQETPLHIAARKKDTSIITSLLNGGADVDARNNQGKIPLDKAYLYEGRPEIIELLLAAMGKK